MKISARAARPTTREDAVVAWSTCCGSDLGSVQTSLPASRISSCPFGNTTAESSHFIGQFRIVDGARQNRRAHDARYRRECLSRRAAADRPAIGSVQ